MENLSIEQLKYPIGKFQKPEIYTPQLIDHWIKDIEVLPSQLRKSVEGLSAEQMDTPYRPEGWTVRQVVHHLPDSHTNSYVRFKLALTEDNPTIKPYEEGDWAQLPDGKSAPVELSLRLLEALHARWVYALKAVSPDQLDKTFYHPGNKRSYQVKENIGIYSWHGRHHLAHITSLKLRMSWG